MPDVFGRNTQFGGAMSADATTIAFSNDTGLPQTGLIIRQLNIQYSQTITRMYALEDGKVYFVAGQTNGQLQMQHVVGPAGLQTAFFNAYGDVCNIKAAMVVGLKAGCSESEAKGSVTVKNPVITSLNLQVNNNDMIIGSGLQMMFTSLEM